MDLIPVTLPCALWAVRPWAASTKWAHPQANSAAILSMAAEWRAVHLTAEAPAADMPFLYHRAGQGQQSSPVDKAADGTVGVTPLEVILLVEDAPQAAEVAGAATRVVVVPAAVAHSVVDPLAATRAVAVGEVAEDRVPGVGGEAEVAVVPEVEGITNLAQSRASRTTVNLEMQFPARGA